MRGTSRYTVSVYWEDHHIITVSIWARSVAQAYRRAISTKLDYDTDFRVFVKAQ